MYATGDLIEQPRIATKDPIERELQEVEDLRERALKSRDILYCSPVARHLVEKEIPRLLDVIRQLRRGNGSGDRKADDLWVLRALAELRQELQIVRDLVERR